MIWFVFNIIITEFFKKYCFGHTFLITKGLNSKIKCMNVESFNVQNSFLNKNKS